LAFLIGDHQFTGRHVRLQDVIHRPDETPSQESPGSWCPTTPALLTSIDPAAAQQVLLAARSSHARMLLACQLRDPKYDRRRAAPPPAPTTKSATWWHYGAYLASQEKDRALRTRATVYSDRCVFEAHLGSDTNVAGHWDRHRPHIEQRFCFLIAPRRELRLLQGSAPNSQPVPQPGFRPSASPASQPVRRPGFRSAACPQSQTVRHSGFRPLPSGPWCASEPHVSVWSRSPDRASLSARAVTCRDG